MVFMNNQIKSIKNVVYAPIVCLCVGNIPTYNYLAIPFILQVRNYLQRVQNPYLFSEEEYKEECENVLLDIRTNPLWLYLEREMRCEKSLEYYGLNMALNKILETLNE